MAALAAILCLGRFGAPACAAPDKAGKSSEWWDRAQRRHALQSELKATEPCVEAGLKWLAAHQDVDKDGRWDCDDFMKHDPKSGRCTGPGFSAYDVGVSGLAVLAFLGAGYTDQGKPASNPYANNVKKGLRFLVSQQDDEGRIGDSRIGHQIYLQAVATLALCEAYGMTRNTDYAAAAQKAVDYIQQARNPDLGWRYVPCGGENDTSVTGWCVMALKAAERAGLKTDSHAFLGAQRWFAKSTDPVTGAGGYEEPGQTGARLPKDADAFPSEMTESMTAVALYGRTLLGEDPHGVDVLEKGTRRILDLVPYWKGGRIDMYFWYFGSLAMYQVDGNAWKKWESAMRTVIAAHQCPADTGARAGSWDPVDPWGTEGGRVYSTAMMTMCLETYYRYPRLFPRSSPSAVPAKKEPQGVSLVFHHHKKDKWWDRARRRRRLRYKLKSSEASVEAGLNWLARHQDVDKDGRWDCDGFMKHDPASDQCKGKGRALYDEGATGLALLAFLGAGYTDEGPARKNPYAGNVKKGLAFLVSAQDDKGRIGDLRTIHFQYVHAIATLALCEAYGMTQNSAYAAPAQRAVNYILGARNPDLAWRYAPRSGKNDTSVTGWCVMALQAAKRAGLKTDEDAFLGAQQWFVKSTDLESGIGGYQLPGQTAARMEGYQDAFPQEDSESMTSVALYCRILLGEDPHKIDVLGRSAQRILKLVPYWNGGRLDMYYWYFGSLAMYQVGGDAWNTWADAMESQIPPHQCPAGSGARAGSWDPLGPWGSEGGRIYSTALMTMCLEAYYRYPRLFPVRR